MSTFWQAFWLIVEVFFFVAYLVILFHVVRDLFRDPHLGGGAKAAWLVFLLVLPLLAALVYLVARGRGMARREQEAIDTARDLADARFRSAGETVSQQITTAKGLLDAGAITPAEFEQLKARAFAG